MQVDLMQLIRKMMAARNIQVTVAKAPFDGLETFDYGLRRALDPVFDWQAFGRSLVEDFPDNALIFAEDVFELHYALFHMPDVEGQICLIGPWTVGKRTPDQIHYVKRYMGKAASEAVQEYYNGVRVVEGTELISTITTLVSMAFPEEEFQVKEMREYLPLNFSPDTRYFTEPAFEQDLPASMLEQRYAAEHKLLDAVGRGDTEAALEGLSLLGRFHFKGRFTKTPYQTKIMMTIMNTLLRKSMESGMVHPYYIDEISSRYASIIENMSVNDRDGLIGQMIREYCAYVRQYSVKQYSPLVQKVINHINLNLSTELSLKSLAGMCYISPSYLSNLFKRETGTTLIDYINTQRIKRAAHLMSSTKMSVATVAERVGILDVNYFTKLFKKSMGQTPTQYRRTHAGKPGEG